MRPPKRSVGFKGQPTSGADEDHTTERGRDSQAARHLGSGTVRLRSRSV